MIIKKIKFFINIFLLSSVTTLTWGNSFPFLVTIEDLLHDPVLAQLYYNDLKIRFRNNNFEEILFLEDSQARSARLTNADYNNTLRTLKAFFAKYPDELAKMQDVANQRPFAVNTDGSVRLPTDGNLESWKVINERFSQLSDSYTNLSFLNDLDEASTQKVLKDLEAALSLTEAKLESSFSIFNQSHQKALFEALKKQFNRKRNPQIKKIISNTLIVTSSGPARLERIQNTSMPPHLSYYTYEDIEKAAIKEGRELNLPGVIVDNLRQNSSFQDIPSDNLFKKGTTVVPMSRGEGVFKGVGPGECVRSSCNRYFDAFFEDSHHLKILKDGKETGYIGIYKVKDKATGVKYWYIETIQSPLLVDDKSGTNKVRGIIKHLQQMAMFDDSLLVLPSTSYNSWNYKEVIGALADIPETATGEIIEAEFRSESSMDKFRNFEISELSEFDQVIARNSGYSGNVLTNGFVFNEGKLTVVGALFDQPDWYLLAFDELKENGSVDKNDKDAKLSLEKRLNFLM